MLIVLIPGTTSKSDGVQVHCLLSARSQWMAKEVVYSRSGKFVETITYLSTCVVNRACLCAPHRLIFPTHRIDAVALRHGGGFIGYFMPY